MELIERINQRVEKIYEIFTEIKIMKNESKTQMEKLIDLVIKEIESLKKSQKPPAAPLVLENGISDIQYEAENVIVSDDKKSNIVNVLSDIKTISDGFDAYYGLLLSSIIMTTVGFIVNLALEVYTFNIDTVLCRKVYDPGGKTLY
jgi:hypothetical protein